MALSKRINPRSRLNPDTGFGSNPSSYGGRFINKDGSTNVQREGVPLMQRFSIFQTMLSIPTWKFVLVIFLSFIGINVAFAFLYLAIGTAHLAGLHPGNLLQLFGETFFFSAQTLTTVGYGHVSPDSFWASLVASFEALCGLMTFAIVTGLVYGRFARPRSFLLFSTHALIAPYRGKTGLMFRLVSYKDAHSLFDVHVRVNLGLTLEENGRQEFRFYSLNLERQHVDSLNMNWTVVHPIDENSPLQGFSAADLEHAQAELYVQVNGFDEVFSATVVQKTSYIFEEIVFGARFLPMYHENATDTSTILELDKLDAFERVALPAEL